MLTRLLNEPEGLARLVEAVLNQAVQWQRIGLLCQQRPFVADVLT